MPKKSKKTKTKNANKLPKSAVNVEKQVRTSNQIATLPPWRTTPLYYSTFGANNWA
jgi:hypothetical protein